MPKWRIADVSTALFESRIRELKEREDARYHAARPRSAALRRRASAVMPNGVPMAWMRGSYHHEAPWVASATGAHFTDVDGFDYADFNIADMSMFCGYAPEAVVRATHEAMLRGNQFMLPVEDAIVVAEELGRRFGLPEWQFTSSASQANIEAIRIARVATGREKVLVFDGKYHGHLDQTLVALDADGNVVPEERGLSARSAAQSVVIPFNDLEALRAALQRGDVALVMTEPALTNSHVLILPDPGFHDALRALTREAGVLLCIDETHTQVVGPGGLTRAWGLRPDLVTAGKSIAAGVPFGAWGMTAAIGELMTQRKGPDGERDGLIATGGTLFGNPLGLAAARAAMQEVLTPEAYAHTQVLGRELAVGMRDAVRRAGLPWFIHELGPRSGYVFAPQPARNAVEARAVENDMLARLIRVWLANRGVWEAIVGAGPTVSVPATRQDVALYLTAFDGLLQALVA
jgi:glutamate-1-semialdehyde 2,1-aminomutase